jgi:glutathione S-transferase
MIRVLGRATSGNVQKVVWLLEELGTPYQREDYGRQFNNTGDAAYLSMNPTGKVPTLVDGDAVVWESNTILRYLCAKLGSDLLPKDPAARSRAERWMDWLLASLNEPYLQVFREARKPENERRPDFAAVGMALVEQLELLEGHLAKHDYLAGDRLSVAEFALGPIVQRCLNFPVSLTALPNLRRWHACLAQMKSFAKVVS